jgi:hypothetical protein
VNNYGATGLHNPALGTAEAHYTLPLPEVKHAEQVARESHADTCTVHAEQVARESRADTCTVHAEGQGKPFTDDLYEKLKNMIIAREVVPTFRPVKHVLRGWEVGTSDRNRQEIASSALDRMYSENVLKMNPANDGTTIKKAKYILA